MNHTVAAIFDSYGDAQSATKALFNEGFVSADVKLSPPDDSREARQRAVGESVSPKEGWGIGAFFRSLFSTDQHADDAGMYAEAIRRGSYLVTIDAATEGQADQAVDILMRFKPVDLNDRAEHWHSSGWSGYQSGSPLYTDDEIRNEQAGYQSKTTITGATPAASSEATIAPVTASAADMAAAGATLPVVEEQLQVGKRQVSRGGVRIYRHVTETPVQESVQLREERVTVERTPVDQPASAADMGAIREGVTEIRETGEEPVVAKTARVVEEVRIGKEITERTETISDTVRRADVEVEQLGATASATGTAGAASDDVFRQHWQSAYGSGGGKYEDYASAYRYGANLAGQKQYQGYRWDELEPQVRSDWEASHQGSPWERTKQAVRYGWEKMTGH